MKNIVKVIGTLFIMVGLLNAEPLSHNGEKDGYQVKVSSEKSLVVGNNEISVVLMQDNKIVKDAKVKIKVFMPEMPGMPYMDNKAKTKFADDAYQTTVNFSMPGTWQYQIKFKTKDGKVHNFKGSINL